MKKVETGLETLKSLKLGADKLANIVKTTLGAGGRNVIIEQRNAPPHVTKDGVTVANSIGLPDRIQNMGVELIKEVASKAGSTTGDGTTTATVLAQAILQLGYYHLKTDQEKINPIRLKRGIDQGVKEIVEKLKDFAQEISHDDPRVAEIAKLSANGDEEIGNNVAEVISKVTGDGDIRIEDSTKNNTFVDIVEGYKFFNGLESPFFITNPEKLTAEFENPNILLLDQKVDTTKEILPAITAGLKTGKPLIIVANHFDGDVILTLVKNVREKGFRIAAVKSPSYGERRTAMLEDLSKVTGAKVFSKDKGAPLSKNMKMVNEPREDGQGHRQAKVFDERAFGSAGKVVMGKEDTIIMQGAGDADELAKHIELVERQREDAVIQQLDKEDYDFRLKKLKGGVGIIYVGANTDVEVKEKKDRYDDALSATRAALKEGILAGGGVPLFFISRGYQKSEDGDRSFEFGRKIVYHAIMEPFLTILSNAGYETDEIKGMISKITEGGYPCGYDVSSGKFEEDMIKAGIIDPVMVTRVALESASSVAGLLITTSGTVCNLGDIEHVKDR